MRTKMPVAAVSEDRPDPRWSSPSARRFRGTPCGFAAFVAAAALLLAVLEACDLAGVAEPEAPLEIVPDSVTLTHVGERFPFTVRGGGGSGASRVRWSSRDTAVFVVDPNGTVTARANGVSRLVAQDTRAVAEAMVVVRQAAAVQEVFGEGQRAAAGLPPVEPVGVRLVDAGGAPVSGAAVRFEPSHGNGRVEPGEVLSDSLGVAAVEWTLGPEPGRQTLAVSTDGAATIEIGAVALDPDETVAAVEAWSGEDQWALAGHALPEPLLVRVLDEWGRGVPSATVRFEPEAEGGRVDPEVTATDSLGLARSVWTLASGLGAQRLVAKAANGAAVTLDAAAVSNEGACNRTPAVSETIVQSLEYLFDLPGCAEVTEEHLSLVDHLYLAERGIRRLRPGDFAGLPSLKALALGGNRLTELPAGVFEGLPILEQLDLSNNQLTVLPDEVFADLRSIEWLDLGHNQLGELPPSIFRGLTALQRLVLSGNRLTTLPPDVFAGLRRLEALFLTANRLNELPPDVFQDLSALDLLWMGVNHLATLPPDVFADLGSLTSLALVDNRLTELPPDVFRHLSSLGWLNLSENALESLLPDAFTGLSRLEVLNLDLNQLTSLPLGIFDPTPRLRWLYLAYNDVAQIPAGLFAGLSELTRLDLTSNGIRELPPGVFSGSPSLRELRLEGNRLDSLPRGVFAGLSQLEYVRLHYNPGAPFPVHAELGRADTLDLLAPGPARVVLRVPGGAPYPFRIPVSVQRGTGSGGFLAVVAGDTVSDAVVVSGGGAEAGAAHVSLGTPPGVVEGFEALEVVSGEPMALFAVSRNRTPVTRSAIQAHRLQVNGPAADIALAAYFRDADRDSLAYEVDFRDPNVARGRIEGATLWLEPESEDTTEVAVTATDPDGLKAVQKFQTWVVPAPDPDAFNIELVFGPGFTEEAKREIRRAADRWMEVVVGDLPDVPVDGPLPGFCANGIRGPRLVGVVDDLVIGMYMVFGVRNSVGSATRCAVREESELPIFGRNKFSEVYLSGQYSNTFYATALHEIGHVLGMGYWGDLHRAGDSDPHFAGQRAVAAFDAAGGQDYAGGKVPLEDEGRYRLGHWRKRVIPGDVMASSVRNTLLTAITVQALADLGHEVDVSKADPYTLPKQTQGDVGGDAAEEGAGVVTDEIVEGPVVVVDKHGKVVRIIRP